MRENKMAAERFFSKRTEKHSRRFRPLKLLKV